MIKYGIMTNQLIQFTKNQLRTDLPRLEPGMKVRVYEKIHESGKERLSPFEGIILKIAHGREIGATFTVRKISGGIGIEKTWPLHSRNIAKINILERTKVRRAKLYYLRELSAKKTRKKLKKFKELAVKEDEKVFEETPLAETQQKK